MPPRRKRAKSPTNAGSESSLTARAQKKSKPQFATPADSILTTLTHAIGSSPVSGVPISQLLSLIAAYAVPFVSSTSLISRDFIVTPVWALDSEWVLSFYSATSSFFKLSILTGQISTVHWFGQSSADGKASIVGARQSWFWGAVQRNPNKSHPEEWFIASRDRIRSFNDQTGTFTLIAGCDGARPESKDGIGSDARFNNISTLIISSDGGTIWCGDPDLRRIDVATGAVTTPSSLTNGFADSLCWDRSPSVKPDTAFYFATTDIMPEATRIGRFDTTAPSLGGAVGQVNHMRVPQRAAIHQLLCTLSGCLIFTGLDAETWNVYVFTFDPLTARLDRLDIVTIHDSQQLLLNDINRLLVAIDSNLTTHTLPPQCFPLPKCCDRDL